MADSKVYRKWIKGECRHICKWCKHKLYCDIYNDNFVMPKPERRGNIMEDALRRLDRIKSYEIRIKKLKQENEELHGVIKELMLEINDGEISCANYERRIEELERIISIRK